MKKYTLDQIKDELIGKKGTPDRDQYEYDLKMEILGELIKKTRKERNLTQEQLGELIGADIEIRKSYRERYPINNF